MYQNAIYICISGYNKISQFPVKNADASRTQLVCFVTHLIFGAKFHHCRIYVKDFRERRTF